MITATGLLLCDGIHEDLVSHNITVLGIFAGARSRQFPTPARLMNAYVLLIGEPGETGEFTLECVEEAGGEMLFREARRDQIGSNGKRHIRIQFGKFSFPRPGCYQFTLFCNDAVIANQPLTIEEVT